MNILGPKINELDETIERLWFRIVNHEYRLAVFIDHKGDLLWTKVGSGLEARYTRAGFLLVGVYDYHIAHSHLIEDIYIAMVEIEPLLGEN